MAANGETGLRAEREGEVYEAPEASGRCPGCGLKWSYHEHRFDCDAAVDRYEAQQEYLGSLDV